MRFCLFVIVIEQVASNRNRLHLCWNRPMSGCLIISRYFWKKA